MYIGMIETRSLKILLKSFHENYSDLLKKNNTVAIASKQIVTENRAAWWCARREFSEKIKSFQAKKSSATSYTS